MMRRHDAKIMDKEFHEGEEVLVFPYGTVEVSGKNGVSFKVNGHRLKKYYRGYVNNVQSARKKNSRSLQLVFIWFMPLSSDFKGYEIAQDTMVKSSSLTTITQREEQSSRESLVLILLLFFNFHFLNCIIGTLYKPSGGMGVELRLDLYFPLIF
ncbi:hypothetical protein Tco_0047182 [Tanacetum coccineum]